MSDIIDFDVHIATTVEDMNNTVSQMDAELRSIRMDKHHEGLRNLVSAARAQNLPITKELTMLVDPSGKLHEEICQQAPFGLESLSPFTGYELLESFAESVGTEGMLADAAKTVTKKALRAIGVAVTIGRYKQAVSTALTGLIGIAVGTLTNALIRDTVTETTVFGTPEQFDAAMTNLKHIVDVVDTMSELKLSGPPDDATIEEFSKKVKEDIRKLISYDVPMSPEGGPRISTATFENAYFKVALRSSGWTSDKVNAAATSLKEVQTYCDTGLRKPSTDLLDLYEGHTTLKEADKMRGRAIARAMRHVLKIIHQTSRLVRSLQHVSEK